MSSVVEIPLQQIVLATNNFAKQNLIASGGYGPVYQGKSENHGMVAVKRLDPKNGQGDVEFRREIALLSEYKHENIVSLLGFCDENDEKLLVYKLESNGSLDKHLNNKHLSWIQRLRICIDAARGLKYLHDDVGPQHRILHRDVKSANILLDGNWNAKISDFGLSRIGPANKQTTLVISNACGTFGYIDPEYILTGCLTQKSDVYSFGVVLFEVLCGRLTRVTDYKDEHQFLTVLVTKHYPRKRLHKIVPFYLLNQINEASFYTFSTIACQCLMNGIERPTMNVVLQQLEKALHNQLVSSCSRTRLYLRVSKQLIHTWNKSYEAFNYAMENKAYEASGNLSILHTWNKSFFIFAVLFVSSMSFAFRYHSYGFTFANFLYATYRRYIFLFCSGILFYIFLESGSKHTSKAYSQKYQALGPEVKQIECNEISFGNVFEPVIHVCSEHENETKAKEMVQIVADDHEYHIEDDQETKEDNEHETEDDSGHETEDDSEQEHDDQEEVHHFQHDDQEEVHHFQQKCEAFITKVKRSMHHGAIRDYTYEGYGALPPQIPPPPPPPLPPC